MQWMLSSFRTVAEVREHLDEVTVVNVEDPRFGGAPLPFHWKIADASGACMILEISQKGRVQMHDAFLGVITNSPDYSWHLTNLRNHIGLSPAPRAAITLDGLKLSPLGGGSGFAGLPGDFTPPSRFIRAAAFTASARPLKTSHEAVFEAFRILDSFNIPAGTTAPQEKNRHGHRRGNPDHHGCGFAGACPLFPHHVQPPCAHDRPQTRRFHQAGHHRH
jgi:choloylglycine hydrolase